jgi:hypothetical protein
MPFCVDSVRNVLLLSFLQFVLLLAGGTRYGHGADATDRAAPSNCFLGISTGPPSKVALVLSSFSTHVSPQQNLFVLLTTRAAEHESYFSHLVGRIVFVSIQYADADLPLINMKRFQIFLEILLHMGGLNEDGSEGLPQCSNVMFLDTYDVFFQGNPFDSPRYSGSLTFTTESKSVGEDIWNAQWIYNCYGIEELKLLHNKTIANGGVAFGPYSSIVTFTGHLLDEFDTRSFFDQPHPGIDGTGLFRYGGYVSSDATHSCWNDQGFLNHLLHVRYSGSDMPFSAPSNFENTVFTVGHNRPGADFVWEGGTLYRLHSDNSRDVPSLVHQLNRFPHDWSLALSQYALQA